MEAAKGLGNVNFSNRIKQIVVLVVVILVGILISQSLQAQDFHKSKAKHFKSKYKTQIKGNSKACHILAKRRTEEPKKKFFAFLKAKPKYTPQAEVDAPTFARTYNKPNFTAQLSKAEASIRKE